MSITSIISIAPLLTIGAVSCYTDLKYGRIPNWLIVTGLSLAAIMFIFLFGYNAFFLHNPGNLEYMLKSFSNIGIGSIVSIFLWRTGLWSAGDAKIFIVYLALVPLEAYSAGHVPSFPGFNLLINLFFPLMIALMISAIVYAVKKLMDKEVIKSFKENLSFKKAVKSLPKAAASIGLIFLDYTFMFLIFQAIIFIISLIFGTKFKVDPFAMYFILLLTMGKFTEAKQKFKALTIATYAISSGYIITLAILGRWMDIKRIIFLALIFMVLMGIMRKVLSLYIQKAEIKEVKIKDMFRGAMIHKEDMTAIDKMIDESGKREDFGWLQPGGITGAQVNMIKEIFKDREETIVRTYRSFPFAPFLSLSAILTFATGTSFLIILRELIANR